MSRPEAIPQSPDGLTVIATLYDVGLRVDQGIATVHAALDAMPEPWAHYELAERQSVGGDVMRVAVAALEKLAVVERRGEAVRQGSRQKQTLFSATDGLVGAATNFNSVYFKILERSAPSMAPIAIKREALGLLALKHIIPFALPPQEIVQQASNVRREHPTHTAYHMLELFVKKYRLGDTVQRQTLWRVRTHPAAQHSRQPHRTVARHQTRV